ncbi:MAG TPA: glutamate synthase subunit beta [Fibrobacteraceae bacterium]|nr:glutamate synthase subunit beta [Fibrobacteraceae bacterium]
MGKPTGFMEYQRELPPDRPVRERVKDFNEFHLQHEEARLKLQGARCMDCGVPFCHSGLMLPSGAAGCPINNLIPEWNDMVFKGLWREAIDRLHKTNNFPEFTGRVCPAPCEGSCVLGIHEPPVAIKNNERAITDRAWAEGWVRPDHPSVRTGKKVAVVGSGPSGLAAAAQLNKAGHQVTVFERADRAGGLLMYGIPNMKLEKKAVVQRRIDLMVESGIEFRLNCEVGKDYPAGKLLSDFDAVVLSGGSTRPRDLPAPGREFKGIHFAMEFLKANTKSLLDSQHADGQYINAAGKDVVIIGGGDTGTDCVATSLRHGCKSVTQLEIMPKAPDKRAASNPWPEWPKTYWLDYGQEEAKEIFGADPRQYLVSTKRFLGDAEGNLTGLEIVDIQWEKNADGRMVPKEVAGSVRTIPAQLVFIAMGFLGPETQLVQQLGVDLDARQNVKAEFGNFATNVKGVFSAGDMRRGQSLVVWAINEGRQVAREVDRYLMGSSQLP